MGFYFLIWLLEILLVLYCVHCIFREKFRVDILGIIVIGFDINMMYQIWVYGINAGMKLAVYALLIVYCKLNFKKSALATISRLVVGIMISALFQLLGGFASSFFADCIQRDVVLMLIANAVAFVIAIIVLEFVWNRKSEVILDCKNLRGTIGLCGITTVLLIIDYHLQGKVMMIYYIVYLGFCVYVLFRHRESEVERVRYEKQLQEREIEKAYEEVYETLIQDIRKRQHDFNNQLNVLYGMHITSSSLEELIANQNEYGEIIIGQRRYDDIPSLCNNKTLAAYLYQECSKLERQGFVVQYEFAINDGKCLLYIHEIIEILGALIENAAENLECSCDSKTIKINVVEYEDRIVFGVSNHSKYITSQEFEKMCTYGYSTKGEKRGIGLARVRELCIKAGASLMLENVKRDSSNWINISIIAPKQKR